MLSYTWTYYLVNWLF